jgi:hypothetical protein
VPSDVAASDRPDRTVAAPGAWRFVLPRGWVGLPTEASRRDAAVAALLDRQFRGTARDELISVRIDIDRRLKADLAKAADAGATHVYALVEPMAGVFITTSVAVAQVRVGADDVNEQMSALLGAAEGVLESGYVELPNLSGIRRRRRAQEALPDLPDAPPLWTTHVDYVLESAPALLLLLLFVTTSDEHADVLVELFDAVAATLHVEGDGDMAWERSARDGEATTTE